MKFMKMKKRSIISVLLIVAMMFSVAAFTASCGGDDEDRIVKITIRMKITGSDGVITDMDCVREDVQSALTVLAVTKFMCEDVEKIDFDYSDTAVKRIGDDISELYASEYASLDDEGEDEDGESEPVDSDGDGILDGDEEEDPDDIVKDYYYDWICTLNGVEITDIKTLIKDGDKIEWTFKGVARELSHS